MANMDLLKEVSTRTYKTNKENFYIDIVKVPAARADKDQYEVWIYDPTRNRKDLFLTESGANIHSYEQILDWAEQHIKDATDSFYADEGQLLPTS